MNNNDNIIERVDGVLVSQIVINNIRIKNLVKVLLEKGLISEEDLSISKEEYEKQYKKEAKDIINTIRDKLQNDSIK
ncbi:MAG: hypothetical protein E7E70_23220 [Escherichia coli]|nr:hypothetical protein [Escherichia coli]